MQKNFEFEEISLDSGGYILIVSYGDNATAEFFKTTDLLAKAKEFIRKVLDKTDLTETAYGASAESVIRAEASKFGVVFCINNDEVIVHDECS